MGFHRSMFVITWVMCCLLILSLFLFFHGKQKFGWFLTRCPALVQCGHYDTAIFLLKSSLGLLVLTSCIKEWTLVLRGLWYLLAWLISFEAEYRFEISECPLWRSFNWFKVGVTHLFVSIPDWRRSKNWLDQFLYFSQVLCDAKIVFIFDAVARLLSGILINQRLLA